MMTKGKTLLAGLAIVGLAVLNFTHTGVGAVDQSLASTATTTCQTTNDEPGQLAWSYPIKCHKLLGSKKNAYSVCEMNGPGNSCDTENATTCTCGENCR